MCPSICVMEHTCHTTSLTSSHSTSTKKSNHPPRVIHNIPQSIDRQLSQISYADESFNKAEPVYQKAIDNMHLLTFSSHTSTQSSNLRRKNRKRDIIWYNLPFSKNVATNVGGTLLQLLVVQFLEEHVLHKIFNRITFSISNSCMPNLKHRRP